MFTVALRGAGRIGGIHGRTVAAPPAFSLSQRAAHEAGGWCVRLGMLGVLLAIAACHGKESDQTLVVSLSNLSAPYMTMMRRYVEQSAREQGMQVTVLDGQGDSAKQTADLRAADVRGAKAVILAPNDSRALASAVDVLMTDHITVLAIDRRLEGTASPVAYVGADNVRGGYLLGQWVVENFPQGADVVLITNDPGSSSEIDRSSGIRAAFSASANKVRIVFDQTANSSRDQALTVTQNILTSLGSKLPQVIICLNDDMAMGALEAIHAAGVAPGMIKVLGFDATPEALRQIQRGEMSATVEQSPGKQVRAAVQAAIAAIRTGATPVSASLEPILITEANLSQAERYAELK
jgi:inositol transport system substrate-binding protein